MGGKQFHQRVSIGDCRWFGRCDHKYFLGGGIEIGHIFRNPRFGIDQHIVEMILHGVETVKQPHFLIRIQSGEILDSGTCRQYFDPQRSVNHDILEVLLTGKKVIHVVGRGEAEYNVDICQSQIRIENQDTLAH